MDSKKLPLWLVFRNPDSFAEKDVYVIFKSGDDLRQDMLTLQMIRLMDKLWLAENLDLRMSPYGCVATGDEIGLIEVVLNSETTANITKQAGGASAAFKSDPLVKWLRKQNETPTEMDSAVDNFVRSCAGYARSSLCALAPPLGLTLCAATVLQRTCSALAIDTTTM